MTDNEQQLPWCDITLGNFEKIVVWRSTPKARLYICAGTSHSVAASRLATALAAMEVARNVIGQFMGGHIARKNKSTYEIVAGSNSHGCIDPTEIAEKLAARYPLLTFIPVIPTDD